MPLPYKIRPPRPSRNPRSFSTVALFNVLEAAAIHGDLNIETLSEIAGYCYSTTFFAMAALMRHGWATRLRQRHSATERGKIALAIHRGREAVWLARCVAFNAAALQRNERILGIDGMLSLGFGAAP